MTVGDNCEIQVAVGRPYDDIQSTTKKCTHLDHACQGGWSVTTVDGVPDDLFAPMGGTAHLDDSQLQELQEAMADYTVQGIAEHTSVASFGKVTLQLLGLGAPASIVRLSLEAAHDEVRHAQLCFAIANQIARTLGQPTSDYPSVFPFPHASVAISQDIQTLAAETLQEGVLGESVAAVSLCVRSRTTRNTKIGSLLEGIFAEEATHAVLAWKTLSFAVHDHAHKVEARRVVETWLTREITEVEVDGMQLNQSSTTVFGLFRSKQETEWVQRRAVRGFVRPLLVELLRVANWEEFAAAVAAATQMMQQQQHGGELKGVVGECVHSVMDSFSNT